MTTLRVIQSNGNGTVTKMGDFCYSGIRSFSANDTERETLFILKEDDRKYAITFTSAFTGETNEEGQNIFIVTTTPKTVEITGTDFEAVHLMSNRQLKQDTYRFCAG